MAIRRLEDYTYAAPFLRDLASQYATNKWQNLELAILGMYVFCLDKLKRTEHYVPAALQMLAKAALMAHATSNTAAVAYNSSSMPFSKVKLKSIISASETLSKPVQVSVDAYFRNIKLDTFVQHSTENDEYSLSLSFDSQLSSTFDVDQINVRLTSIAEGVPRSINLSSAGSFRCEQGSNIVNVSSQVSTSIRCGRPDQ